MLSGVSFATAINPDSKRTIGVNVYRFVGIDRFFYSAVADDDRINNTGLTIAWVGGGGSRKSTDGIDHGWKKEGRDSKEQEAVQVSEVFLRQVYGAI